MIKKATVSAIFPIFLGSLFLVFFILPTFVLAETFNLSYNLTEGGTNRLELDQNNQYKGVRVNINSDVSSRYEVTQRVIQPLERMDTPGSSIRNNFVFRGLRGTNRYGDLRISTADSPVRQEDLLYVSDNSGRADSFTLVYGLIRPEEIDPGDYFGRISFTLNPIGSTWQPVTQILEVHINIARMAGIKPEIEITTSVGSKQITLHPRREKVAGVVIKINGKFKKPFSIKQLLLHPPESLEGERLDYKSINFIVQGAVKGTSISQLTACSPLAQDIYRSAPDGDTDTNLIINYSLSTLLSDKAGKYRSEVQYLLDEMGVESKIDSLELNIENDPIFDLVVTPQDQKYLIEFRGLKPLGPSKREEVVIEIKTNRGRKYQVIQEIPSELRNKTGSVIPSPYFTFQTQSIDTKGKLNFPEKKEVKDKNNVLFVSDDKGSPDKFKVIYELSCPLEVRAGDYSTNVVYSLLEM